jgi:HSP20 family molecular chaperone IbpA
VERCEESAEHLWGESVAQIENNPIVSQLHAMKQRMDVLYSKSFAEPQEAATVDPPGSYRPPVDIWDAGKEWLILVDLPGVGHTEVDVEFVEDRLLVQGQRQTAPTLEEGKATQVERPHGAFSRTFILPTDTRAETITAELKHGVLRVSISKAPGLSAAPRKVQVRVG